MRYDAQGAPWAMIDRRTAALEAACRFSLALERIILRSLEKEPADRFPSAETLGDALTVLRRWVSDEALPELARICDRIFVMEESRDSWTAFMLAREIEKLALGEPMLERLRAEFSHPVSIRTEPPGASVSATFYGDPDGEGLELGPTPLEAIPYPRGLTRLRVELPGHRPVHDVV